MGRISMLLAFVFMASMAVQAQDKNPLTGRKILVFSSTKGFRHGSIGAGKKP